MLRFFNLFTEIIGWLQIVASPFLVGIVIGALIYLQNPSETRLIFSTIIVLTGLITGIIFANKVWRKKGTINFLSLLSATPELDNEEEAEKTKNSSGSSMKH
ncbi:MAG TPA: hypothetical protein PKL45_04735 [Bacteroidia bacterium]|nr:hypothetical protein [Bacteroidia bacterium]